MRVNRTHRAASFFLCLALASHELYADVIPGRWEIVDSQEAGSELIIKLKPGDRIECIFSRADPDDIIVRDRQGMERKIRKTDVARVETTARATRSGRRGAFIGAVAGAAPMAAVGALLGHSISGTGSDTAQGAAILGGLGAGIGALAGFAIGKAQKDTETVYVAPGGQTSSPAR